MRFLVKVFLSCAAALMVSAPVRAHADGYVSPFIGVNVLNNSGNGRADFGFDAGWMGKGVAGLEFDLGYAPSFFGNSGSYGGNSVTTATGNLIVGIPVGGARGASVRPYVTGGLGLLRAQADGMPAPGFIPKIDENNVGFSGGVGVMAFVSRHAGVRGDVRYFRSLNEDSADTVQFGTFHFWRASFGVILR